MKKELILKGRADAFNHIRWRFMTQKKFVESISVRLMCDRCGSRRNEVMWCRSVWWDKGTGLMWTDGMHALWNGGKDAVQTGTMHLTRDPKMHHAFVLFYIYIYFLNHASFPAHPTGGALPPRLHHCEQAPGTGRPLPSQLSKATWNDSSSHKRHCGALRFVLVFCPFFFLMHESIVNHLYTCFLTYNAMDETRQVAWISKGRGNSNLK